jgi:hypothetical protein
VTSRTTASFRKAFDALPTEVQDRARDAFHRFSQDPDHPSLRFRQVHATEPIFSARVGLHHRALTIRRDDIWIWFWIGSHGDYDRLLARL